MNKIFEGFKNFILRGNAVDLAVGVVIGAAFSGLVSALVKENDGTSRIQTGSNIIILFGGEKQNYQIVSPTESDILKNKISYQSPLGQVLMGKEAGKEFDFMAGNKKVKVKILEIK